MRVKEIVAGLALLIMSAALAGCQTTASSLAGKGDIELTPQRADFVNRYLSNPNSMALAISPDGLRAGMITCPEVNCYYGAGSAEKEAIELCESEGGECNVFAIGKKIVWLGQISLPELPENVFPISLKRLMGGGFRTYTGFAAFTDDQQKGRMTIYIAYSKCSGDFSRISKKWSLACDNEETFSGEIKESKENLLWGLSEASGIEFRVSQQGWKSLNKALSEHAQTANAVPQPTVIAPSQQQLSTTVSPNAKRHVTLNWQNRFEKLKGDIQFVNSTKAGRLIFDLPENGGRCIGAFAITAQNSEGTRTGEWEMSCPKFVTAKGVFDIGKDGGHGVGKDSNGNALTFTLSDIQRGL